MIHFCFGFGKTVCFSYSQKLSGLGMLSYLTFPLWLGDQDRVTGGEQE